MLSTIFQNLSTRTFIVFLSIFTGTGIFAQTNILVSNSTADNILKGNYNPADYTAATVINDKVSIVQGINNGIRPDSLKSYMLQMNEFGNRNTGSDTTSPTIGIGAARKWAFNKLEEFSAANDNRLLVSYLQFDQLICSVDQHRNIFGILPGSDTNNHEVVFIEGHIDSRCDVVCDSLCDARGMEDNATGSALVLELARVMSQFTYKNTIVFLLTIGEEQGLYGANAFSQYCLDNNIPVKAVFNNDVVGGIICGATSSAPSCPGLNDIDSTNVRLFSLGGNNSPHKQLSRYTKLQYKEELLPIVDVPMTIHIMSGEDRVGRGGDHIPFRQDGFTAIRTTSANEHGDASNGPGYTDRQHTINDILGLDTTGDGNIDSFFVDFNYLGRNSCLNGVAAAMAAIGPLTPAFSLGSTPDSNLIITITNQTQYPQYRVGLRTNTNDWDTVYTLNSLVDTIEIPTAFWYNISVASVNNEGVESFFGEETYLLQTWLETPEIKPNTEGYELLQNRPNPFDEATIISVYVPDSQLYTKGEIVIRDLMGNVLQRIPIELNGELNEVLYEHGYGASGVYTYSLEINGEIIRTKRMIFAF